MAKSALKSYVEDIVPSPCKLASQPKSGSWLLISSEPVFDIHSNFELSGTGQLSCTSNTQNL